MRSSSIFYLSEIMFGSITRDSLYSSLENLLLRDLALRVTYFPFVSTRLPLQNRFVNEQLNPTYHYIIFLKSDRKSTWTKIVVQASNRWLTYAHRDFLRVSTLSLSSCCKEHDVHNRMALLPHVSPCNSAIGRAIAFLGSLRVGRSDRVKVWRYNRSID